MCICVCLDNNDENVYFPCVFVCLDIDENVFHVFCVCLDNDENVFHVYLCVFRQR